MKEVLFKEAHEQLGVGKGHWCAHGGSLDLEAMLEIEEVAVGEDKLGEMDKELCGW